MLNENRTSFLEKITSISEPLLFLRPDGFGKSHFVNELKHFFAEKNIPVLALHFGERRYEAEIDLDCVIQAAFQAWESVFFAQSPSSDAKLSEGERFARCILAAEKATQKKCAILIDDYDFPLLCETDAPVSHFESALSSLYGTLSTHSQHFSFAILLGTTRQERLLRFVKPRDVSFEADFSCAAGFFSKDVKKMLEKKSGASLSFQELSDWYGGYRFCGSEDVFCAKSVIRALEIDSAGIYFPSNLFAQRAAEKVLLSRFDLSLLLHRFGVEATDEAFFDFDVKQNSPLPFLFQFGFLTKKAHDSTFGTSFLFFANKEARASFFCEVSKRLTSIAASQSRMWAINALRFLEKDDLRSFFASVNSAISSVSEKNLKNALSCLFGLMSIYTTCIFEDGFFMVKTPSFLHVIAFDLFSMQNAFETLYSRTFTSEKKSVRKTGVLLSATSGVISYRTL